MRASSRSTPPGRLVVEGEDVDAADPVFAGREHLFEPPPSLSRRSRRPAPARLPGSRRADRCLTPIRC